MNGKLVAIFFAVLAVVAGAGAYYLQVFYYYDRVEPAGFALQTAAGPVDAQATAIEAIDAISSPIKFRACFDTRLTPDTDAEPYPGAVPLTAPFWFDCFDAAAIGAALEGGTARAFLSEKNVAFGADRVIAITDDGRGYVWHQLNDCGELAYDGTQIGEDCPPREDFE